MRARLLVLLLLLAPQLAWAQTGNFKQIIMQDVTGAFTRFTRLTIAQRDASTHNTGEVIWCTDCAPIGLWVFDGTQWVPLGGGGGGTGDVTGTGAAPQVAFWTAPKTIAGDPKLLWATTSGLAHVPATPVAPTKSLLVGTVPLGTLKPGHVYVGLDAPANATGMQAIMAQVYQGAPGLAGLVTLGDDRVGVSSWNFRSTGASNPIYGGNFGVVFNTDGVANGVEIDVQNDTTTNIQGQALWLNGSTRATGTSGTVGHRSNAILIDTQDGSKWDRGILFKEGFVANGATGSILTHGIHFERNQDADFIVIQPRVGTSGNVALKLTNPEFTINRFTLLNSGAIRVGNTMTGAAFPSYAFVEDQTTGLYMEADAVLGFAVKRVITCPVTVPPQVPPCFAGDRRMTLGASGDPPSGPPALNLWPWGTGANQGGGINFYDPSSAHSVGFLAPDFVSGLGSFRIRLPAVPGLSGQCLLTSGPTGAANAQIETWSYGACGTGGGGGGSVTNTGVLGLNQLILGNGGVDIKGMGSLGTSTTVLHGNASGAPTWGPVMVPDIGATGTPSSTTFLRGDGTWSTVTGTGTVTTSGVPLPNQVAVFTGGTVITGDPKFLWSNSGKTLSVGTPGDATSVSKVAQFAGRSLGGSDPVVSSYAAFAGANPLVNHPVPLSLIADFTGGAQMPVGFGVTLELAMHDYAGAGTHIPGGFINSTVQILSPPTTTVVLGAQVAGVATPLMSLDNGQALFGRRVASQVSPSIDPAGGSFVAARSYAGGATAVNDGLGVLIFSGEGVPGTAGAAAHISGNVDGTGGSRVKGRLSFHVSDGTSLVERMRISSDGIVQVGSLPAGGQALGPLTVAVSTPDNATPYQSILGQMVNGSSAGVIPVSIINDKAAISGWAFRGAGGTSPIYGGHFGVKYETPGVALGLEIGVQNNSGATGGQGVWINGSGANHRDNAILIDTQDASKWNAGIRFTEGFVAGGATGSTLQFGIIFDKSADADFLVIRPRLGAGNAAIRITDPTFAVNKFLVTNLGDLTTAGVVKLANLAGVGTEGVSVAADGTLLRGGAAVPGGVTTTGAPLANQFAFFTGANSISGSPSFTFNAGAGIVSLTSTMNITGGLVVSGASATGVTAMFTGTFVGLENFGTGTGQTGTLYFRSINSSNFVGFKAPNTAAGNPVWVLPPTLGAPGSVLANDGVGNLSWAPTTSAVTGSGTVGQFAVWSGGTVLSSSSGPQGFAMNGLGQVFYTPTSTTGTFGFLANGTRRTEVQFYTNNSANAVVLIAPATATGNHVWTLPSTWGTSGDVLTNNGSGGMFWSKGITVQKVFGTCTFTFTNGTLTAQSGPVSPANCN